MWKSSITLLLALIFVQFHSLTAQNASDILKPDFGEKLGSCPVCGMDVFERMLTRVELIKTDTIIHACALGCAAKLQYENQYDSILVADFERQTLITALEAYYLFGSRVIPARAMLPEFSFVSQENAARFQSLYGGTVLHGEEAFAKAAEIRLERMNQKKKKEEEHQP